MAKIKVVHLITGLGSGGAESMLLKLLCGIDRDRFENVVVSLTTDGWLGESIRQMNIPVYCMGMRPGLKTVTLFPRLIGLLRNERPAVLQTWLYHADLLGLVASWFCPSGTLVWNVRTADFAVHSGRIMKWTIKLCAWLSRFPDAVIANSEVGRRVHASLGYQPRHWSVIPNGFDLTRYRPDLSAARSVRNELGLSPETLLVGLVARHDPVKDHANFLQAARLLIVRFPDVHFVLVGANAVPTNSALAQLIATHGLQGHVHLLGERADIPRLTAALDIATSSSYLEGFPNVIGEAMACGVPCVVTDVGDSATLVGDSGKIIPPRDPVKLAGAWQELIQAGAEGRHQLGHTARQRIDANYGLENIIRRYETLYCSLAESQETENTLHSNLANSTVSTD